MIHDGLTRREFIHGATATTALTLGARVGVTPARAEDPSPAARVPVVIASANGMGAVERAMQHLQENGRPLDAVIKGVNRVEEDPNDHSVGLGGLPNEDGVVELDSCCMDGKTHRAGGRYTRGRQSTFPHFWRALGHSLAVLSGEKSFLTTEHLFLFLRSDRTEKTF